MASPHDDAPEKDEEGEEGADEKSSFVLEHVPEDSAASVPFWCCGGAITNEQEGNEIFHLQKGARVLPMVGLGT